MVNSSPEKDGSITVDILTWVMKATVDVIGMFQEISSSPARSFIVPLVGEAAFGYKFGALEDADNDLLNTLRDVP